MGKIDIRWQQRFDNFLLAFAQLDRAVQLAQQRPLSELEQQGLIRAFEFTHELAWNVLKDYLSYQGISNLMGSRDTTREAFQKDLIADGEVWMEMIKSRNMTSRAYNKKSAEEIAEDIKAYYHQCFAALAKKMQSLVAS